MAESRTFGHPPTSPLFDKMDALMRKHRTSTDASQEIPVLTDEAVEPEFDLGPDPILAKGVSGAGLMFDLRDFSVSAAGQSPAPVSVPLSSDSAVHRHFVDLPLLDLDQIARTRGERDPLDLAVDEPLPEVVRWPSSKLQLPAEEEQTPSLGGRCESAKPMEMALDPESFEVEEIDFSSPPQLPVEDWEAMSIPTLDCVVDMAVQPIVSPAQNAAELPLQIPSCGFAPEPVTVISIDEAEFAASHIEIELPPVVTTLPSVSVPDEPAVSEETLTLSELSAEPETQVLTLESPMPGVAPAVAITAEQVPVACRLDDMAVSEITAAVAAQISVEVSTEVAQLARQHFAGMMTTFYNESLRKITEEISRDMEMCLAPRIAELVREELCRQGLCDPSWRGN